MCFSSKDMMDLFGNDEKFKLEYTSEEVEDTSTINKLEDDDNKFKSNIKI